VVNVVEKIKRFAKGKVVGRFWMVSPFGSSSLEGERGFIFIKNTCNLWKMVVK